MRDNIKFVIKLLSRFFLKLFWLFPLRKKNIFFMSTMGKSYSCNPKYIYQSMLDDPLFSNCKFIWVFKKPEKWSSEIKNIKTVIIKKSNYIRYFYYLLTSKTIIYNCGGFSYAPIRKNQFLIETWHGGGSYKTCGFMTTNKSKSSKLGIQFASKDIKIFLSSSETFSKKVINDCLHYYGKILNCGCPRNDNLVILNIKRQEKIREKLGIEQNEGVVLFAPTFKGTENNAINVNTKYEILNINLLKKTLKKKYKKNWKVFTRGHQYANSIDLIGSDGDLSDYSDMQELLDITDILITDYSSSIWDFALTKKTCLLFVPDIDEYILNDRAFLTKIEKWPGIIVKSNEELNAAINNLEKENYEAKIDLYLKESGSYECGDSCKKVKEIIAKELGLVKYDKKII